MGVTHAGRRRLRLETGTRHHVRTPSPPPHAHRKRDAGMSKVRAPSGRGYSMGANSRAGRSASWSGALDAWGVRLTCLCVGGGEGVQIGAAACTSRSASWSGALGGGYVGLTCLCVRGGEGAKVGAAAGTTRGASWPRCAHPCFSVQGSRPRVM